MQPPKIVGVRQARSKFSTLIREVERGDEVVILRHGEPVAKLVPFTPAGPKRIRVDTWKGRIHVSPDFDAPLSDAELRDWGL